MEGEMNRRDFMKVLAAAPLAGSYRLQSSPASAPDPAQIGSGSKDLLEPFNYGGVRLLDGPLKTQYEQTRDYYFKIPDDDILKGFRRQAGLPAPGADLGGWCSEDSYVVFGQWLSGMARMSKATGDAAMLDKARLLLHEWSKTIEKAKLGHYVYDKTMCGLIDLYVFAGRTEALPLIERITDGAIKNLGRTRNKTSWEDHSGDRHVKEGEWYTLSENIYRAYQCTKEKRFKDFGDVWRYPHYWGMFTGQVPINLKGMHAYSHVNSLSSAAMTYAVTGEPEYLKTITQAYQYFQDTQCYATGGFGPGEMLMPEDGTLGRSVAAEPDSWFGHWPHLLYDVGRTFETPCGSWAIFKLCRYLMQFTGEARFGDWMEKILYNGIGAALPMARNGNTFYYSDYRLGGGSKVYYRAAWPCCSGTYIQAVADYHNIIYFRNPAGLFVNLFVPSEVLWNQGGEEIKLVQTTGYPESETTLLTIQMKKRTRFSLRLRVPAWAREASVELNGAGVPVVCRPGDWAVMEREWDPGDRVAFRMPMQLKLMPVDKHHANLVALANGPVVLVQSQESPAQPWPSDFSEWLVPGDKPLMFHSQWKTKGIFEPFYRAKFGIPYQMYFQVRS